MISVVMRTVNRAAKGKPNFIGSTLRNLNRSGFWDSPHLARLTIVDSGSQSQAEFLRTEVYANVPSGLSSWQFGVDLPATVRTHNENGARALEVGSKVPCEWVLSLEDDIDVIDGFLDGVALWLSRYAEDDMLLYTFGSDWPHVREAVSLNYRAAEVPIRLFYGAQAFALKRELAVDAAQWLGEHTVHSGETKKGSGVMNLDPKGGFTRCHDLLLHNWAWSVDPQATYFRASAPSFVQHTGNDSYLNNQFFEFPTWPGREWRMA